MGFFDKLAEGIKNFDYEGAADSFRESMEQKQKKMVRQAHEGFREKARNATEDELRYNLQNAIDNDNYIMEEEIKKEMDRRGMYY